jgi:3-oxoacyl-[acyl-carrier protein] reductase
MINFNFDNKTILVTGGTRGIGSQIAEELHELGAFVLITGTNAVEIDKFNIEAKKRSCKKKYIYVDFLDENSSVNFFKEINNYDKIDGIVNNAGINRLNHVQNALLNDWTDMLEVNLTAPFRIIKNVAPIMIKNSYGRIVNIASIFGVISKEKRTVYSATKFGIHGLTVGCSNDLARYNILVNTVSPGFVLTDLTKKNLSISEIKDLENQIPIKRIAETRDISSVVIFLLSNLNQYLTGQNIIVDGGFTNV